MADVLDGTPVFCTRDELATKLGTLAIDIQDLSEIPGGLDAAITQATDDIRMACHIFPYEALAGSRIVRNWCKVLAAYYATGNGGEPHAESLKEEADRVFATLDLFLQGKLNTIPDLAVIPGKEDKGGIPVVSRMVVDVNMAQPLRVDRGGSSGAPVGYPVLPYFPGYRPLR